MVDHLPLEALLERIGDSRLVLLGEASHGSSEFYRARQRITRALIEEKGFDFVANVPVIILQQNSRVNLTSISGSSVAARLLLSTAMSLRTCQIPIHSVCNISELEQYGIAMLR